MKTDRIWQPHPCDDGQADILAHELGISSITARLLSIRGRAMGNVGIAEI